MGEWFLGEIRTFPYGYAPEGWLDCDGRVLNINQYQALYSLLGNYYGGTYPNTFALPDLRGRVAVHPNPSNDGRIVMSQGILIGEENHTLTTAEVPSHTHVPQGNNAAGMDYKVANNAWAKGGNGQNLYDAFPSSPVSMNAICAQNAGGGLGHPNMQPFQVLRYCIAVQGVYPSRP